MPLPLMFVALYLACGFMVWLTLSINKDNVYSIMARANTLIPGFKKSFEKNADLEDMKKPPKLWLTFFTWPVLLVSILLITRMVWKAERRARSSVAKDDIAVVAVDMTAIAKEDAEDLKEEVFNALFPEEDIQVLQEFYGAWRPLLVGGHDMALPSDRPKLFVHIPKTEKFIGLAVDVIASIALHRECLISSCGNGNVVTVLCMRFSFGTKSVESVEDFKNAIKECWLHDVVWSRDAESGIWNRQDSSSNLPPDVRESFDTDFMDHLELALDDLLDDDVDGDVPPPSSSAEA